MIKLRNTKISLNSIRMTTYF